MRFWDYSENGNELRLEGPIDTETWWGDEVTPKLFREELEKHPGPLTVYINSPGGDVFAASEIYTMLLEHKGAVTVKIDALAASAASVIAMAGTTVLMAPTAYLMIHDPLTAVYGNKSDLKEAIATLETVKEGLINAYELKTKLPRDRIDALMRDEGTWLNAYDAMELGFADGLIEKPEETQAGPDEKSADGQKAAGVTKTAARGRVCVYNSTAYARLLVERIKDSAGAREEESDESKALRAKLKALSDNLKKQ